MASTNQKTTVGGGIALILLLLGLAVLAPKPPPPGPQPGPTTTTSSTTSSTTTTISTTVPGVPSSGTPFFSPSASWNRPVSTFGPSPALAAYADRWWRYGGGTAAPGSVNVAFGDYSVPIYDAAGATTKARIFQTVQQQALYTTPTLPIGSTIPWNPTWKPGTGNDNLMIIVDRATDRAYELGGIGQAPINCFDLLGPNGQAGFDMSNPLNLCTFGGASWTGLYTVTDGTTTDGRGMGINKLALITRADEVKSGAIRHALEITITSTMFGQPACEPIKGASASGAGVDCGYYLPPATKLERTNPNVGCAAQVVTPAERSKTIPEGMRFALHVTDAEIDTWLDSRKYTGALRSTARVFAVAMRDYGWIVAETGCFGMSIETDGIVGPQGATWAQLGVGPDGSTYPRGDLLAGLITASNVYVVAPPS